jgi:hypothetical protein
MAQSPYTITGVSSTALSVNLGGIYRKIQCSISATSSTPAGTVWIMTGPSAGNRAAYEIFHASVPDNESDAVSGIVEGFFDYVNAYITGPSSSYTGTVSVKLYFDGCGWPSS